MSTVDELTTLWCFAKGSTVRLLSKSQLGRIMIFSISGKLSEIRNRTTSLMLTPTNSFYANTIGETFTSLGGKNIQVVVGIPVVGQPIADPTFSNICELVSYLIESDNTKEIEKIEISSSTEIEEEKSENYKGKIFKHPQDKPLAVIGKPALYVRESYEEIYHMLIHQASSGDIDHKFLITGTAGTGKSCFLIYFLIRLLCESNNATIIFQPLQSEKFYCFEGLNINYGSYDDFSAYLDDPETWYLADGILSPKLVFAKTIVALSPKGVVKDKFQFYEKDVVRTIRMPPWSFEELSFCRKIFSQTFRKT
ncbi:hypothetical protein C1645_551497 [Glomus cerebriforme]|uniref:Uncharacterized protein n=1 Tax=Glomus cerebriforme TaxID=658196 RepID=A0A397THV4_9GLOM|nr:hypothetical protein C1645_551497 [Glomus cerebriforme]